MPGDLERAIGRLIWVGVRGSDPDDPALAAELDRCERAHAAGIVLFDLDLPEYRRLRREGVPDPDARRRAPRNVRSPEQLRCLIAHARDRLAPDLLVSIDQEGGRVARLTPAHGFPSTPSARDYADLPDPERTAAARTLATTLAALGIDLNLAPCVDLAVNPTAPGLAAADRLFARNPRDVADRALEQIRALHDAGLACCLKHFPGLGSARADTHEGFADITDTWVRQDELAPYRDLIAAGVADAVMPCHAVHRGLDPDRPASLSGAIITGLLRQHLGFAGVVITDSLDMRAVRDRHTRAQACVLALEAGADVLLDANNLGDPEPCPAPEMHGAILDAVHAGRLTESRIMQSVARLDHLRAQLTARRATPAGARP